MKRLIVYYSRTGNNERLAALLNEKIEANVEKLIDLKNRRGILGFLRAGFDGTFKRTTKIGEVKFNPGEFDLVIFGFPVWNGRLPSAIRTYLRKFKGSFKTVACFSCNKGGPKGVFKDFMEEIGLEPVATLNIKDKELKNLNMDKVNDFLSVVP
ncbi:MAG: flavodoxin family protein [Candidatus Odinarchaeia archaeon]